MKHLKRFNESNSDDVVEFCEQNLTTLLEDEGYSLVVNEYSNKTYTWGYSYEIIISKSDDYLEWDKFKLDFLPFIELLTSKYKLRVMRGRSVKTGELRDNIISMNGQSITKEEILDVDFKPQSQMIRKIIIVVDGTI